VVTLEVLKSPQAEYEMVYNLRATPFANDCAPEPRLQAAKARSQLARESVFRLAWRIEFPGETPYAGVADEFVRLSCREYAGWRRDEWAYSPLFIWCKFLPEYGR